MFLSLIHIYYYSLAVRRHIQDTSYNYPLPSLLQIYPLTLISVILSTFLSKFSLSDLL